METVKILVIGDTHVKTSTLDVMDLYINLIVKSIDEHSPDFVVMLGDTLDSHNLAYSDCYNKALKMISSIVKKCDLFLLIGNHDYINQSQFLSDNHFFNPLKKWKGVTVVDKVKAIELKNHKFIFCPYVPKGKFLEAVQMVEDWQNADCIFGHQEFKGAKMGAIISQDGDEWNEDYPYVISGHIHDYQKVGSNVLYTGSSLQHSFGENGDKALRLAVFTEIDDQKSLTVKKVKLSGLPEKKIVHLNLDELNKFEFKDEIQYKVKLEMSTDEFKTFKKSELYKKLSTKVKFETTIKYENETNENKKVMSFIESLDFFVQKEPEEVRKIYEKIKNKI